MLREQSPQMVRDGEQTSPVAARDGHDGAAGENEIGFGEQRKPRAGEARVDAEDQSVALARHGSNKVLHLCRDTFKDVGWDVEVGVNLLDVVVFFQ